MTSTAINECCGEGEWGIHHEPIFFHFLIFELVHKKDINEVDFISVGQRVFVFNDLLFSKQF